MWYGIAIERYDLELMTGERQFNVLRRAPVQNMEEDALAFLDAHGFAVAKRFAVDAKALVADLPTVGFGLLIFFFLARLFGGSDVRVVHLLFGGKERLPLVRGQKNFLIVLAGGWFLGSM